MAVTLHRCSVTWIKGPHPCWKVQHALDEAGIPYELVKHSPLRGRRPEVETKTGQRKLPALEFEDGTTLREESKDLVERIRRDGITAASAPAAG